MPSMWNLAPRLAGEIVLLEPLSEEHFGALLEAARPPEIWTWWTVAMAGEAAFRRWFDDSLQAGAERTRPPFEARGCQRVEFSTNERNERARRALEALPARFEGVRRDDRLLHDGNRRS